VFYKVGRPVELREFNLPAKMEKGSALCRVLFSTICGSDLHTITGKRTEPTPLILGHEIVGEITELDENLVFDGFGNKLAVGDRISWTIMASCGECFYCKKDLPQKCIHLKKYGHASIDDKELNSGLVGGYSEYIYIMPGTTVYKVPDTLSDEIAAPANCALSTVVNAVETIGIEKGDIVMIQGAGLLGINACALAVEAGAKAVVVTDIIDERLEFARLFGAGKTYNTSKTKEDDIVKELKEMSGGFGIDVVIEVCGAKQCVGLGIKVLRTGGKYLLAGLVNPGSTLGDVDANQIIRKYITIKGIHNYKPEHLGIALKFLEKYKNKYPFHKIVSKVFDLDHINEAVTESATGKHIRVGIKPW
jgi:putative phosphonate catabolism associated alcohol dehydrogenase